MSRLLWLPDILADAFRGIKGYQVDVVKGWATRSAQSTLFEPRGVMNHHTGPGSYAALLNYMTIGSSIAPLSQVATSRPNNSIVRITIMAAGRCNHAGIGHLSWTGSNGSNRYCIGLENQNDGRQSWPKQQLEGIWIANAALLNHLGVGTIRLTDHKTYAPNRKIDPHSLTIGSQRSAVQEILNPPIEAKEEPLDLEEIMAKSFLVQVDGSKTRYEVINDPDNPGRYALRPVPNPAIAASITADHDWRKNVVEMASTNQVRIIN